MPNQRATDANPAPSLRRVHCKPLWGLCIALAACGWADAVMAQGQPPENPQGADTTDQAVSWAWGSDRAIIEIVEFTDFACTFCAKFHQDSYAELFSDYVATGKARWVFVPFASGRFRGSEDALAFAICSAEQGRDPASLRSLLFERREAWSRSDASKTLKGYADELGLDGERYTACSQSEDTAKRIRENGRRAREAGVRGTPQLFIEGFPVMGALPTAVYRRLFDQAIERVQRGRRVSTSSTPFPEPLP